MPTRVPAGFYRYSNRRSGPPKVSPRWIELLMSSTETQANERPDDSPESTAIPQSSHIDDNSTVTSVALLPPPMWQLNESGSDIEINPTAQSTNDHEGQSKGTYTGKNIGKEISESKTGTRTRKVSQPQRLMTIGSGRALWLRGMYIADMATLDLSLYLLLDYFICYSYRALCHPTVYRVMFVNLD